MCRNWQTRQTQNLLFLWTCGFESHHRHFDRISEKRFFFICKRFLQNYGFFVLWITFMQYISFILDTPPRKKCYDKIRVGLLGNILFRNKKEAVIYHCLFLILSLLLLSINSVSILQSHLNKHRRQFLLPLHL